MNKNRATAMSAMPSNAKPVSRRNFLSLSLAASGLLLSSGVLRYLSYAPHAVSPTEFDLGPADNFPPGSRTVITEAQAMVLNTASGFVALSLLCPHLGCQVNPTADGFACPCHGSRFDVAGQNVRGPADRALRELKIAILSNGHLHLDL